MLSIGLLVNISFAATAKKTKAAAKPAEAPAQKEESGPENTARVNGFKKCLGLVKSANDYVFDDFKYAYYSGWNKKEIESHPYNVQGLKFYSDGIGYSTYQVSLNPNGLCDVVITQTSSLENTCNNAREKIFKDFMLQGTPQNGVVYLSKDNIDLFLITPTNGGCHYIKQEFLTNQTPGFYM